MNYLSHQYIARCFRSEPSAPPLFFAGNLLPDLLAISGDGRIRTAEGDSGALSDGVKLHLLSDKQFHGLPAFRDAQGQASKLLLSARWVNPPHRRFFLAHIMTELALDAAILTRHPDLPGDLYDTLSESLDGGLVAEAEILTGRVLPNLQNTIRRFIESRFLYLYATPDGLASSLVRIGQRVGVPNFKDPGDAATLAHIFKDFSEAIAPQTDDLLRISISESGVEDVPIVVQ